MSAHDPHDPHDPHDRTALLEELLPDALTGAAASFPPPSGDLLSRSVARGARRRRARTAGIGAAALALAATTTGGALLAFHATGSPTGTSVAVGPAAGGASAARPTPTTVTGQQMVSTLTGLLPSGGTVSHTIGHGSPTGPPDGVLPSAALTWTTADGTSGIDVTVVRLSPPVPPGKQSGSACQDADARPHDTCTVRNLPDGGRLTTVKSFTVPSSRTGQRRWYVMYTTNTGAQVVVEEYGGGEEKESSSAGAMLLSTAQLAAIAQSPAWRTAIAVQPVSSVGASYTLISPSGSPRAVRR